MLWELASAAGDGVKRGRRDMRGHILSLFEYPSQPPGGAESINGDKTSESCKPCESQNPCPLQNVEHLEAKQGKPFLPVG